MKAGKKKKIGQAIESLEDILKRIGPYMPKLPQSEAQEKRHWKSADSGNIPLLRQPKHNQVTSPF